MVSSDLPKSASQHSDVQAGNLLPLSEAFADLNLPAWGDEVPPADASWEEVMAHFAPLIEQAWARPDFEEMRLSTKVYVPFVWID
jgi:hypothetical protein